ncbi:MAG: type II toxin-antitoxin system HicA family toxin [Chloroflexi bacterium]|nr:type II toxin-antitoxin system HicA family toxin [Chloroflexota bacterium]
MFDLCRADVPIFFHGRGVLADIYYSAPSRREVLKVLRRLDYCPVPGRGKGSHEVWRGPDNRVFTVPARDPLSVGVFRELLAHFGWTKEQYLRDIR